MPEMDVEYVCQARARGYITKILTCCCTLQGALMTVEAQSYIHRINEQLGTKLKNKTRNMFTMFSSFFIVHMDNQTGFDLHPPFLEAVRSDPRHLMDHLS
jgi:hypothetical protein